MNATMTKTTATVSHVESMDTVTKLTLGSMASFSAIIGVWASACLIGATLQNGPGMLIQGFFSALIG